MPSKLHSEACPSFDFIVRDLKNIEIDRKTQSMLYQKVVSVRP